MRVIHTADLHLGFSAYTREAKFGENQRRADVAQTFARVIDMIIARAPELVIIAGDVFHSSKPDPATIVHAHVHFTRLVKSLPDTIVVIAAGNHDTPNERQLGSILPLFQQIGIHVAIREPQRFHFPYRSLSVLAVPDAGAERPSFAPDGRARFNVCCAHLETAGLIKYPDGTTHDTVPIESLNAADFNYIGVGHYHDYTELAPNACYSGSIDYTSSNIWSERRVEKARGFGKVMVERDLETGAQVLLHIPASRLVEDIEPIDARGMGPKELDAAVAQAMAGIEVRGAIVRLRIHGATTDVTRELDPKPLREWRAQAVHFRLDAKVPVAAELTPDEKTARAASTKGKSLEELLVETIQRNREDTPLDLPVETTIEMGLGYLADATAMESDKQREPVIAADVAA